MFPDKTTLVAGMFDDYESTRIDVSGPVGNDGSDTGCTVMATVECQARLIPDLFGRQPGVRIPDIGRIADNRIETLVVQVPEPVRLLE